MKDLVAIVDNAGQEFGKFYRLRSKLSCKLYRSLTRERFGYIPSVDKFLSSPLTDPWKHNMICLARFLDGGESFVDLGCGVGHLMKLIVRPLFDGRVAGVEVDGRSLKVARVYLKGTGISLIRGDMFEVSLRGYDRVFTYVPIRAMTDRESAPIYYERLLRRMSPGTRWFEVDLWRYSTLEVLKGWGYEISCSPCGHVLTYQGRI